MLADQGGTLVCVVGGLFAPALASISVAAPTVRVAQTLRLRVGLDRPAVGDTVVQLTSSDSSVATVPSVTVPSGQTFGEVDVQAISPGPVTVLAQLGVQSRSMTFQVVPIV